MTRVRSNVLETHLYLIGMTETLPVGPGSQPKIRPTQRTRTVFSTQPYVAQVLKVILQWRGVYIHVLSPRQECEMCRNQGVLSSPKQARIWGRSKSVRKESLPFGCRHLQASRATMLLFDSLEKKVWWGRVVR